MTPEEMLARFPAKPVADLLELLAQSYANADDPENPGLPRVTLHLCSGRDLLGCVIKLGQDPARGQTLLVRVAGADLRSPEVHALYVPVSSIEAVTVNNADRVADLLSDGALPAPPSTLPAPSRLELARNAEELAQMLAKERGVTLKPNLGAEAGLEEAALRSLSVLVKDAFAALSNIAADPLGKTSLAGVKSLRIVNGTAPDVRLTDGSLEIMAALAKGRAGRLSRSELESRMASLL